MKFYITGTKRGLGEALKYIYGCTNTLEECDVFINCKHNGFEQVDMLYKAAKAGKRVISIGSHASDFTARNEYAVEKRALKEANNYMFMQGHNVTCINFGFIDTERSAHVTEPKLSVDECCDAIHWILEQTYRIKEITICPSTLD